jgi:hypothetical protein
MFNHSARKGDYQEIERKIAELKYTVNMNFYVPFLIRKVKASASSSFCVCRTCGHCPL